MRPVDKCQYTVIWHRILRKVCGETHHGGVGGPVSSWLGNVCGGDTSSVDGLGHVGGSGLWCVRSWHLHGLRLRAGRRADGRAGRRGGRSAVGWGVGWGVGWDVGLHGLWVADSELSGVLVLTSGVVDELDTIALSALGRLEVGGWSPHVAAIVLGLLDNGVLGNSVLAGALEEDERDSSLGGGVPGDL